MRYSINFTFDAICSFPSPLIFHVLTLRNDVRFHRYYNAINGAGLMYFNNYSTRYLSSEMEIGRRRARIEEEIARHLVLT